MKKRILTLLLALTLVAALFCMPVSAARGSGATAMSADTYQLIVNYLKSEGELYNTVYSVWYTVDVSSGLQVAACVGYDTEADELFLQAMEDYGNEYAAILIQKDGQVPFQEEFYGGEYGDLYGIAYITQNYSPNDIVPFTYTDLTGDYRTSMEQYNNALIKGMMVALKNVLKCVGKDADDLGLEAWARELDYGNMTPFVDVLTKYYFYDPVVWAVMYGVTNGTSEHRFSPNDTCTRAQVVTFLWRAADSPEPKSSQNPFVDVDVDNWYGKAVLWAVEKGITNGVDATHFAPSQGCTRGQVVTFLQRYLNGKVSGASNPFTDVSSGAYYYDAVLWAVSKGITNGTSPTTFSPDATCTRGQIVTFLYRAVA